MKKLHEWTEEEYTKLKASGFLFEFYPEATGEWGKDGVKKVSTQGRSIPQIYGELCSAFDELCDRDCSNCAFNDSESFLEWARGL